MGDINQWIGYAELTEVLLSNNIFTWSNAVSESNFDRILVTNPKIVKLNLMGKWIWELIS